VSGEAVSKPGVGARLMAMVETYGPLTLLVWFAVFFANIGLVALLLELGLQTAWMEARLAEATPWLAEHLVGWGIESPWLLAHGVTLAAAYLVAKALMPARIALVAALLPWIARRRSR